MKIPILRSKKGNEMTLPIIVAIVIGLVIIVVMLYLLTGKSKTLSSASSCDDIYCNANPAVKSDCSGISDGRYVASFTPCTFKVSEKEVKVGRCCVKEDFN